MSAPYTVITSDAHAGASVDTYREYLDAEHQKRFDEWRGGYKNPQRKHIGSKKHKNWDDAERMQDMEGEGIVGEVVFPNTVPPFFRSSVLICGNPRPEEYALRLEGIRAHNRWLVDWCAQYPERRAGIGLVYLNNIDDAIDDVRGRSLFTTHTPVPAGIDRFARDLVEPELDTWAARLGVEVEVKPVP